MIVMANSAARRKIRTFRRLASLCGQRARVRQHLLASVFAVELGAPQALQTCQEAHLFTIHLRVSRCQSGGQSRRIAQRLPCASVIGEHLLGEHVHLRATALRQRS